MEMDIQTLNKALGNIDLYLLDQILKGAFNPAMKVLDAGCGEGRNLTYFLQNGYDVYGVDANPGAIRMLQFVATSLRPSIDKAHFKVGTVEDMPFEEAYFDLVVCNAVLHFARNHEHFKAMFSALVRVLKPGGILFVRTASSIGIEDKVVATNDGCYDLPDGSKRYLIHKAHIEKLPLEFGLEYIAPFKTVNVEDKRSMSVLVLKKL